MSWWYEVIRLLGVKLESREIERILEGEANSQERKDLIAKLKPFIDKGRPKDVDFNKDNEYKAAQETYDRIRNYYDKLRINGKPDT